MHSLLSKCPNEDLWRFALRYGVEISSKKTKYTEKPAMTRYLFAQQHNGALRLPQAVSSPIQRKCAFGHHTVAGGKCAECQKTREGGMLQRAAASNATVGEVPPIVRDVLRSPGQPLDAATRAWMEPRFGHDFSGVRVHTGTQAAESTRAVNALAYTVGHNVVFGAGQYAPRTSGGQRLLAHELTHVVQQRATAAGGELRMNGDAGAEQEAASAALAIAGGITPQNIKAGRIGLQQQAAPDAPQAPQPQPRRDYVFIMGAGRDPFYRAATRYFRAHTPEAVFVTDLRTMSDLLAYVRNSITEPVGNLYIVSHGNEDGTLAFALDEGDQRQRGRKPQGFTGDSRLSVPELRKALHPATGSPSLRAAGRPIDAQTRIHIRGCNVGQNEELLNLIDEAFGGAGQVIAPTHEQVYGYNPTLGRRAQDAYRHEHPRASRAELKQAGEVGGTYEALSGPAVERPGTERYRRDEINAVVDSRYGHLSERGQQQLERRLLAGQRVDRHTFPMYRIPQPTNLAQARSAFAQVFRTKGFRATEMVSSRQVNKDGGTQFDYVFNGRVGAEPRTFTVTAPQEPIPSDRTILANARGDFPNPDDYTWRVARTQHGFMLNITVIAERVRSYLHHGSLNATPNEPFNPGEDNSEFYKSSTFKPKRRNEP